MTNCRYSSTYAIARNYTRATVYVPQCSQGWLSRGALVFPKLFVRQVSYDALFISYVYIDPPQDEAYPNEKRKRYIVVTGTSFKTVTNVVSDFTNFSLLHWKLKSNIELKLRFFSAKRFLLTD